MKLNSIYWCFAEDFCSYIHQGLHPGVLSSCSALGWLLKYDHTGLEKMSAFQSTSSVTWKHLRKRDFSVRCFVEVTSEAMRTWQFFFVGGNFWLLTQTHYTWLVYSNFLCFFIIQFWECFEPVHIFLDFPTIRA